MTQYERLTLAEAAVASERSISTLRRWLARGVLTRFSGAPPAHGGSAPTLIDRSELMIHLASTGQRAQCHPLPQASTDTHPVIDEAPMSSIQTELLLTQEKLAAAHEISQARLETAQARLEAAHQANAMMESTITSLEIRLQEEVRLREQERQERAEADMRCTQLEMYIDRFETWLQLPFWARWTTRPGARLITQDTDTGNTVYKETLPEAK